MISGLLEFFNGQLLILRDYGVTLSLILFVVYAFLVARLVARGRRNYLGLPELPHSNPTGTLRDEMRHLTVVIPARDEEDNIERAVKSFPGLDVVVVDDGSSDRTAQVARAAGARVVSAPPLPAGYSGKSWALMTGTGQIEAKWLLFVDADTWYDAAMVPSLLHYALQEGPAFVTPFLRHQLTSWPEKAIVPVASALYFCGINPRRVNSRKDRLALANGQCLLALREAYEFVGGHKSVAKSVIEDIELAKRLKQHRMDIRAVRAERLGSARMFNRFGQAWRYVEKDCYRLLALPKGNALVVMIASALLWSWWLVLVWLLSDSQWAAAGVCCLVPSLVLREWYGGFLRSLWAPVGTLLFQVMTLSGVLRAIYGLPVTWKGRKT